MTAAFPHRCKKHCAGKQVQEVHLLEQQALHSVLHSMFLQADPLSATCISILGRHPGVSLPDAQQVDC